MSTVYIVSRLQNHKPLYDLTLTINRWVYSSGRYSLQSQSSSFLERFPISSMLLWKSSCYFESVATFLKQEQPMIAAITRNAITPITCTEQWKVEK